MLGCRGRPTEPADIDLLTSRVLCDRDGIGGGTGVLVKYVERWFGAGGASSSGKTGLLMEVGEPALEEVADPEDTEPVDREFRRDGAV